MRTTVNIDEHLLAGAKRLARERGVTLGTVLEDGIRRELAKPPEAEPVTLPTFRGGGGLRPGIDPHSNRSYLAALDEGVPLHKLR